MPLQEGEFRAQQSEKVQELERQLQEQKKIVNNYRKDHGKLQVFFDQVMAAIEPITPLPVNKKIKRGKGKAVEVVKQISDTHMGMVQDPYEVEDINAFSPDIHKQRSLEFTSRFIDWVNVNRNGYRIDNCTVLMTGDLISGDIHEELKITNAFPVTQQIVEAAKVHAQQLAMIAPEFGKVTVHFIVEDNHSRLTKKPQAKEAGLNSYNYLVGVLIKEYLSKVDNIEFNIYPMLEKVVSVLNIRYLIGHGHNIRGWMGVPWYGIERQVGKESQKRMSIIMSDIKRAKEIGFNKYVHGHFHTPFDGPLYSCSGSLSGTDAYDHKSGRYSKPSQPAWLVHPVHGEFGRINFDLGHIM